MDPDILTAAGAAVAGLLALLGLRRRNSPAVAGANASTAASPGATVAAAGASATRAVTGTVGSLAHQVLTLATGAVDVVGATVSKGAGLVVDGGAALVEAVLPGSAKEATPAENKVPTEPAAARRRAKAEAASTVNA